MQDHPQQSSVIETRMETLVKVYKHSGAYQHDAAKLAQQGWTVKDTSQGTRNRSLAGKLIVPLGLFTKPTEILITYERTLEQRDAAQQAAPTAGLSLIERTWVPKGMPRNLTKVEQLHWTQEYKKAKKAAPPVA